MTTAIFRKAWADLRANRLQNELIFIILMLATVALTVSLVVLQSANDPWMRTHDKANGAHIWLVAPYADTDFSILDAQPEVEETTGDIVGVINHPMVLDGEQIPLLLYGIDERPPVATPLLADGRWVKPDTSDEVVFDFSMAKFYDLAVGDTVGILYAEGVRQLEIVGLSVSTHWITYQENTKDLAPGVSYVSTANLEQIEPNRLFWRKLYGIRLFDAQASADYVPTVYDLMDNRVESTIEWQWLRDINALTNTVIVLFMSLFSILGLISVGFILGNAIGGQMLAQYREIGMLKAIGFKPRDVLGLFLMENLLLGSVAAVIGIIIGLAIGPAFASPMAELLNTTPNAVYDPVIIVTVLAVILGAVSLFTIFPAWRASRIDTIRAITIGQLQAKPGNSRMALLARRLGLPMPIVVGVKDVFARPFRTGSSVMGLSLTITVIVFAVGAFATISDLGVNPMYFQSTPADMKIARNFVSDAQTRDIFAAQPEIETFYSFHENFVWAEGYENSPILLEALSDNWQAFDFRIEEGRMIKTDGEAIIGYGLQNTLGVALGDTITVIRDGEPFEVTAVGFLAEQYALGFTMRVTLDTYRQQVDPAAEIQNYGLALASDTDREALADALSAASNGQFRSFITSSDPNPVTLQLRDTALSLSALLLLIGVVNLLSMSLLSIRERARDFGIQKAIGFTPRQIRVSVMAGVALIVLLAIIVGVPIGVTVFHNVMGNIGTEVGSGPNFGSINYGTLLAVVIVLMGGVALIGSYFPARRATQIEVAEVLRYE